MSCGSGGRVAALGSLLRLSLRLAEMLRAAQGTSAQTREAPPGRKFQL